MDKEGQPRRRGRRVPGSPGVWVLLGALVLAVAFVVGGSVCTSRVTMPDEPAPEADDLVIALPKVAEADNAVTVFRRFPRPPKFSNTLEHAWEESIGRGPPIGDRPKPQRLFKVYEHLGELRTAADKAIAARVCVLTTGGIVLPTGYGLPKACDVLMLDADVARLKGNPALGLDRALAAVELCAKVSKGPTLPDAWVDGAQARQHVLGFLEWQVRLAGDGLSPDVLRAAAGRVLACDHDLDWLQVALKVNYDYAQRRYTMLTDQGSSRFIVRRNISLRLIRDRTRALLAGLALPPEAPDPKLTPIPQTPKDGANNVGLKVARELTKGFERLRGRGQGLSAHQRGLAAWLLARAYKREHGAPPGSLADCGAGELRNPWTGQPLGYDAAKGLIWLAGRGADKGPGRAPHRERKSVSGGATWELDQR